MDSQDIDVSARSKRRGRHVYLDHHRDGSYTITCFPQKKGGEAVEGQKMKISGAALKTVFAMWIAVERQLGNID